jgi:hypothetical protein
MKDEVWKPIPGYEGHYEASSNGRLRSVKQDSPTVLTLNTDRYGYHQIGLYHEGERHYHTVHRLVAKTFIPRDGQEELEVNHKDGDKKNNHIANLEWVTRSQNMKHSFEIGIRQPPSNYGGRGKPSKGAENGRAKMNAEGVRLSRAIYATRSISQRELGEMFGVCQSVMGKLLRNDKWKHVHVIEVDADA